MIKSLISFVLGNAAWDMIVVAYIIKKIVEILIGLSIILFIVAVIFG